MLLSEQQSVHATETQDERRTDLKGNRVNHQWLCKHIPYLANLVWLSFEGAHQQLPHFWRPQHNEEQFDRADIRHKFTRTAQRRWTNTSVFATELILLLNTHHHTCTWAKSSILTYHILGVDINASPEKLHALHIVALCCFYEVFLNLQHCSLKDPSNTGTLHTMFILVQHGIYIVLNCIYYGTQLYILWYSVSKLWYSLFYSSF